MNLPSYKCSLISRMTTSEVSTRTPTSTWLLCIFNLRFSIHWSTRQSRHGQGDHHQIRLMDLPAFHCDAGNAMGSVFFDGDNVLDLRPKSHINSCLQIFIYRLQYLQILLGSKMSYLSAKRFRPAAYPRCSISRIAFVVGSVMAGVAPCSRLMASTYWMSSMTLEPGK